MDKDCTRKAAKLADGGRWNKCDYCGRFIAFSDFADGKATHTIISVMSQDCDGEWEHDEIYDTLHEICAGPANTRAENK